MALPSLTAPEFFTKIPSTGKEIKYRPFLVKEEKILLMALEGNDQNEITNAIITILGNCLEEGVDVSKLATFDVEYLFLKLRGKSVGEVIELRMSHSQGDCKHRTDVGVNIDDINVTEGRPEDKIQLNDEIGIKLRYAGVNDLKGMDPESSEDLFALITGCIEFIYDNENVYSDFTKKEMADWLEQLSSEQFKKVTDFFEAAPKLTHEVNWTCAECGTEDTMKLEGLTSFFM
jgi:hypothetical protein|tara:strand:+ start:394 stop:1089 length:696 start_codon:yes stop_codon:yes gene_type:complete